MAKAKSVVSPDNSQALTPPKTNPLVKTFRYYGAYYVMFLPILAFYILFRYRPMYGVLMAFKDFKYKLGILGSPWADPWYKWFHKAFRSQIFLRSVRNTLIISSMKLFLGFMFPIAMALIIDALPGTKFRKTFQTISYLPHFMSWVVLAGILKQIMSPTYGALNAVITFFGGEPYYFFGEAKTFRWLLFWSDRWKEIGYGSIIYLAAISGIDQQMLEAAKLDGASRFQTYLRIIIPCIMPIIVINLILGCGSILSAGFDQVLNMYSEVTFETGDIIDTYTHRVGLIDQQFSFSSAVGLFGSLVGCFLVVTTNALSRKFDKDSALY